jgi:hypothetical protein
VGQAVDVSEERWTPPLHVRDIRGRCYLWMANYVCGEGTTLQEAADDLLRRLLELAIYTGTGGPMGSSAALGPVDARWSAFVHELGVLAAQGADVRARAFGPPAGD